MPRRANCWTWPPWSPVPTESRAHDTPRLRAFRSSLPERAILEQVNASGESTVPQIARSLLLPRQVVQRLADAVHERGLTEFLPNPAHRRSRLLRLAVSGRGVLDQIIEQELRLLAPVAETLAAKEVEACARVMAALTTAMHGMAEQLGGDPER